MAVTFEVCDVVRADAPLPEIPLRGAVEELLGTGIEACGAAVEKLIAVRQNAFLAAAWRAYAEHRPLVLTPDAVWLCIAQGFAAHIRANAEALRGRFVRHEGKATLEVVRSGDFVPGSPDNPWPAVFHEFSQKIAEHIGRQRDLVVCDFSTTGPVERAASELVLMDAMQQYFEYALVVICGIPEITLEGTVDDWKSVRRRTQMLAEYDLEWWTSVLVPVLDEFVTAASGQPHLAFWRQFFEDSSIRMCGRGPEVHGWIFLFFPYLTTGAHDGSLHRNHIITAGAGTSPIQPDGRPSPWLARSSLDPKSIPLGLSQAPLKWVLPRKTHSMDLIGGFVGIAQDPATCALRPAIGWAIRGHGDPIHVHRPDADRRSRRVESPPLRSASTAPDPGIFVVSESTRCSRASTPEGRLILARTGLYFIPSNAPGSAHLDDLDPWLGGTSVGGAIHLAPPALAGITRRDYPLRKRVVLELTLPSGERLGFSLSPPPAALGTWLAEVPPR